MYRSCLLLILCWFGAFAYRIDYDLEELQGWKYADCAEEIPECIKDIVIVLDTSRSIGSTHFEKVQSFLQKLVTNKRLDVQQNRTRIGFVTFSKDNGNPETTRTRKRLDIGQKDDAEKLGQYFRDLKWDDVEGGHTRTDLGLQIATEMFIDYKSKEPGRDKYADVAIVITDGKPRGITNDDRDRALTEATALKAQGVLVIGAGVGEDFSAKSTTGPQEVARLKQFMKDMASTPENVVFEENFEDIDTIIGKLVAETCCRSLTTPPPPPTTTTTKPTTTSSPPPTTTTPTPSPVKCKCAEERTTRPFFIKHNQRTVTLPELPKPDFECTEDGSPHQADLLGSTVTPQMTLPIQLSVEGSPHNYTYEFNLANFGLLSCPTFIEILKVSCTCKQQEKEETHYIEFGKSTVKVDLPEPTFTCYARGKVIPTTTVKTDVEPKLPDGNKFGRGVTTYNYEFTLDKAVKDGPLSCPVTVDVRIKRRCGGKEFHPPKEVCCCGAIYTRTPGRECCGTSYYDTRIKSCCNGTNVISHDQACLV